MPPASSSSYLPLSRLPATRGWLHESYHFSGWRPHVLMPRMALPDSWWQATGDHIRLVLTSTTADTNSTAVCAPPTKRWVSSFATISKALALDTWRWALQDGQMPQCSRRPASSWEMTQMSKGRFSGDSSAGGGRAANCLIRVQAAWACRTCASFRRVEEANRFNHTAKGGPAARFWREIIAAERH